MFSKKYKEDNNDIKVDESLKKDNIQKMKNISGEKKDIGYS